MLKLIWDAKCDILIHFLISETIKGATYYNNFTTLKATFVAKN